MLTYCNKKNLLCITLILLLLLPAFKSVAAEELPPGAGGVPVQNVRKLEHWLPDKWYVRLNGGWGTEENFGSITTGGNVQVDRSDPGLIGLTVGKPIVENFRDWPIDIVWNVQLIRYIEREPIEDFWGGTLHLKVYWKKFPWDKYLRTRLGFAEGISYVDNLPSMEREHLENKDRNTSHLLNYLDASIDVNLRDLTKIKKLESCWLGFAISHRSGVFSTVDMFGNVSGGSNFNTLYIEYVF
jgi:outer membrane protein